MEFQTLLYRLKALTVYRDLLGRPIPAAAVKLLDCLCRKDGEAALCAWSELGALLLSHEGGSDLSGCLHGEVYRSDGAWPQAVANGQPSAAPLEMAARKDLDSLSALAQLDSEVLRPQLAKLLPPEAKAAVEGLPGWASGPISFDEVTSWYRSHGAGPFAQFRAFLWEDGQLLPVPHPDIPSHEQLIGYRLQRSQVEANTRALLAGNRVNNILLFGESGTGKSATVKSLLTLPDTQDLRLIEVEKNSVRQMPRLIRSLAGQRQKFILFIDDLAFDQDDQTYGVLKTILEGGLEPRPANVAIYATSNRRNLVRQTFSDRAGDEVDRDETIQEKTALADRFGLRIPYLGLAKPEYLELVDYLAGQAGLPLSQGELHALAVRWDVRHPGRSPRSAQQFIASLRI